jgi:ribose-phosphate pyrophosphokinase
VDLGDIALFALGASRSFGGKIAAHLGIGLAAHEERDFEDGEHKARPLVNVRNRDVFVVQSLYGEPSQSVNDKLCRLLFFLGALHDASAGRVTVVAPYLCYARKDRRTKFRDPVTTRYVAQLLEAVGADHVVTLDAHNLAAFQNAFRCRTEHLEARMLFVRHFVPLLQGRPAVVISPDEGGLKRVHSFVHALGLALGRSIPAGFMEKHRSRGVVSGEALYAEVNDRTVIVLDDLISSGTTLLRAARAARTAGAREIHAAASHGLFMSGSEAMLADPALSSVVVTDTVPSFRVEPALAGRKLTVLETAPLFAEAIRRMHDGDSVVELLGPED